MLQNGVTSMMIKEFQTADGGQHTSDSVSLAEHHIVERFFVTFASTAAAR